MKLVTSNPSITMTSLELVDFINIQRGEDEAELRHDHFTVKVPKVLGDAAPKFLGTAFYTNGTGAQVERSIYTFPKREACLMAMSYSYELQAKVFDKMTELEASVSNVIRLPDFTNPAEAARAWADQVEARQLAEQTKHLIGSRREATAMNTASQAVKKIHKLEAELDRSKEYASVKRMGMIHHGQPFNWRHLKSTAAEMNIPPVEVFDANYGTVKAYHADVWREAYAIEIEQARSAA